MKIKSISFGSPVRMVGDVVTNATSETHDLKLEGNFLFIKKKSGTTQHATTIFNIKDMELEIEDTQGKGANATGRVEEKKTGKSKE
jgi:hypothetical protein